MKFVPQIIGKAQKTCFSPAPIGKISLIWRPRPDVAAQQS
jgi:hypothetical protein